MLKYYVLYHQRIHAVGISINWVESVKKYYNTCYKKYPDPQCDKIIL